MINVKKAQNTTGQLRIKLKDPTGAAWLAWETSHDLAISIPEELPLATYSM